MRVAIGGCIHDNLDPFASIRHNQPRTGTVRAAILSADIDRRLARRFARGDLVKFAAVIAREKHIVMRKFEPACASMREPDQCRKRSLRRIKPLDRLRALLAKLANRDRVRIGIAHHSISMDRFTACQLHAARPASCIGQDLVDALAHSKNDAFAFSHLAKRFGEGVYAAFNQPDTGRLNMRDQHQCRGRGKRR